LGSQQCRQSEQRDPTARRANLTSAQKAELLVFIVRARFEGGV